MSPRLAFAANFYNTWLISSCSAHNRHELEDYARDWIVQHWTRSQRPNDNTALPDDVTGAQLTVVPEAGPLRGFSFHTDASGGVAFTVYMNDYCNVAVEAERCGVGQCNFPS